MKRNFTKTIFQIFISFLLIIISQNSQAALKPVAQLVKDKYILGITFRNYDLFFNSHEINDETLRKALSKGTSADIVPGKLSSLVFQHPEAITISVPFNNSIISVDLVSTNLFTDDFTVLTGDNKIVPYTPGVYYRGTIKGNPNSLASFSFFNNEIFGTISDNVNGNIVIGRVLRPGNTSEYIIYSDGNLLLPMANYCNMPFDSINSGQLNKKQNQSATTNTVKCARMYYEVDNDIYVNNSSNVVNTTNWMTAVHNNVSTLYANDNITVSLSQVYVWSTTDPYTGTNSTQQLNLFHTTRASFNGDVGQLVGHDGGYGGLAATINGLCNSFNYSYADVNYSYSAVPTYSWTVEVVTHEFGHILGSYHTHNCSWPGGAIDNCGPNAGYPTEGGCPPGPTPTNGGTIMSYCHLTAVGINFNNGFGPYPAGAIQNAINNASCLGTSCVVCPVPAYDLCSTPATLSIATNCVYTSGSLCGATQTLAPINCGGHTATHGYDVWYTVTPTQNSIVINCQSGTSTDVVLGLYSGSCGSLSLVSCADATTTGGVETISSGVTSGVTYYIRVYDFTGKTTGTDFGICVTQNCPAASNNSCANATPLTIGATCSYTSGDLCSATQSFNPSACSGYTAANAYDVFYSITPTQSNVKITCQSGSATDCVLGLFSGNCSGLSLIQCNDSTGAGGIEIINASLTVGNTYYIRVYDWSSNQYGTDFQICARYLCNGPNVPTGATAVNPTICAGSSTSLNVSGTLSPGATYHWYTVSCGGTSAGTGTSISVSPSITTTYFVREENGTCYSNCVNVGVTVTPIPTTATSASPSPATVCAGSSSTVSVTGTLSSGATWHWYTGSCGGTAAGTGPSISVSPSSSTTYYVRAENGTCYSTCKSATVNTTAIPSAASAANSSPGSVCAGTSSTLSLTGSLTPGASWHWYSGSCGGTAVGTGSSISVSPSSTTTYYVRAENGGCYSSCQSATVNVTAIPNSATAASPAPASVCSGSSSTIALTGTLSSGATWHWYSGSCGGTAAGTGSSISVSPSSTTTYYVRAENGNCYSACTSAVVTVVAIPSAALTANANQSAICSGSSSTLSLTGSLSSGATWHWYSGSCGGTSVGTGASVSVSPTSTTSYFVRAENGGCYSACQSTSVNVTTTPNSATSINPSPASICSGNNSTITISGSLSPGATWHWYTGSCGGTTAGTGASLSVSPSSTTTYYLRAENGSCYSACQNSAVSVTTVPSSATAANASPASVCAGSSSTISLTGTLSPGATWHWYTGSCGGTSAGTGVSISVSPSSTKTYYVRAENGSCYSSCQNAILNVTAIPTSATTASASPSSTCSGTSSSLSLTGTLSSGATWHWYTGSCGGTPAGTGSSMTVSPSSTTTYYVRAENGSCFSSCKNAAITVTTTPNSATSANPNPASICAGSPSTLTLTGTLSSGAAWHWYAGTCGGTSAGTGASVFVSPISTTTYYVRAENGNCYSACQSATVNSTAIPNDPISANAVFPTVCAGSNTTLNVNGSLSAGAKWKWYSGTCGGLLVDSGASIVVSPLTNTTYYVREERGVCYSACVNTTVNTITPPADPVSVSSSSSTLCIGELALLQVSGTLPPGSDWYWYTGSCGGVLEGQGPSLPVSPQSTQTYYVRVEDAICHSNCLTETIVVNPLPASPTININNNILSVPAYAAYQWYSSSDSISFIVAGNSQQQTAVMNEFYFVVITDANGCSSSSDTIFYQGPNYTGVISTDNILTVYPNPTYDIINIKLKSSASGNAEIKIFDDTGKLVYDGILMSGKTNSISLTPFAAGIYQLLFSVDGAFYSKKLLKQ